tara:strand:+ start:157 stop:1476 length:1320 start_codon:yes stop_codon:yes gene_type:complete
MNDPYKLPDGPVAIQFSGGRTSGYMLKKILDRYDGALPDDCHVLFQNTGREMPETLDFVHECQTQWNVPIVWLERLGWPDWVKKANKTCRASKAIGAKAIAPRYVAANLQGPVLDFGAGKVAMHSKALLDQGISATPYEIGRNIVPGLHDINALDRKYPVVMASNVLNVMPDEKTLRGTLMQMSLACGGVAIFNLPKEPRYGAWDGNAKDISKLISIASEYFGKVEKIDKLLFKATGANVKTAPAAPTPFKVVDYKTASRSGEPFNALIEERKFAPNSMARFCTSDLKVLPAKEYMIRSGYTEWAAVVGFRADENRRVNNLKDVDIWETLTPLHTAGVIEQDINLWWSENDFDLNVHSSLSNCDGCFLKGEKSRAFLAKYYPDRAKWWADIESTGRHFRNPDKSMTWAKLISHATAQSDWVFDEENDTYCDTGFGGCHD